MPLKRSTALAALLAATAVVAGQSALSTAGGEAVNATGSLSCTVGQPAAQYASGPVPAMGRVAASLSEGVQQPYELRVLRIGQATASSISVYPNPTEGDITVEAEGSGVPLPYRLYSAEGRLLLSGTLDGGGTIGLHSHPSGSYLLRVGEAGQEETFRIVRIR